MAFITPVALPRRSLPSSRSTRSPRMIATEPTTTPSTKATPPSTATDLSTVATTLLSYVRGHKSIFRPGRGFNSTHATLFRKNDTGRLLTPLDELATNAHVLPGGSVAAVMLVQEEDIVTKALAAMGGEIGGLETGSVVSEILEFDLRYMLRVISYGIASGSEDFLHENNWGMMKMLHREVGIAVAVDVKGLRVARDVVVSHVSDQALADLTTRCFDVVIAFMEA
eukprot:GFKZ01006982.1.p2 GENE.GFKZ01006982.1~~GFKZ01006982.1.p2  ORF type:complete len:225 (+),score=41.80 GFKZ01006982.1:255-929(+)